MVGLKAVKGLMEEENLRQYGRIKAKKGGSLIVVRLDIC
jgi:hypothetical protein